MKFNVLKSKKLLQRAVNLPNRIIDDEDFSHSKVVDRQLAEGQYERKRVSLLYEVQELMLETRSFIKAVYGIDSEYFRWIHKIGFTSENKGFVMNTFNVNHNKYWQEGKREIISLLSNIVSEEEAKAEQEIHNKKDVPYFRLCLFALLFLGLITGVWQLPASLYEQFIAGDKISQARAVLSICTGCLSLIVVKPDSWKELFAAFVASALIFIPLLK